MLRTDAANAFSELAARPVAETTTLVKLVDSIFDPKTKQPERIDSQRRLSHELSTKWKDIQAQRVVGEEDALFPLSILAQTKRGYLVSVARQMNGCYVKGWYDGCAVMMRRLLETSIIEAFEGNKIESKIKNASNDYFHLTDLIDRTLAETTFKLTRNTKPALPRLRDAGHLSAHSRYFIAKKPDIDKLQPDVRVSVEELLRIAGLLPDQ
jgi:hypothetical protein